ncbi:hypothetical protein [Microbacterium sp. 1.5R]|uniref:hypothetical protein n=1 Tax=Microbacterium sp. 1.5R TaxID=1916917 RepID=UPI0011A3FB32|nr:hypothetical protein [Microbacterium sp. 1.5R]
MDERTEEQTEVAVDGTSYILATTESVQDLQDRISAAAATTGTFVDIQLSGGHRTSVLIGRRSRVIVVTETVDAEPRIPALILNSAGSWDLL